MKSKFTHLFLLLGMLICTAYSTQVQASHMEGADLRFRCLGGNQYEITLSFYRDCSGVDHGASINIDINSISCGQSLSLTANRTSIVEASPLCPSQLSSSTCNGGTLPGVQLYTYTGTVTLPATCNDWILSWRDGNRNSSITNVSSPDFAYMYVEGLINNLDVTCNNSPDFTTLPIPYICDGVPFSYNHGVIDPEGDSLRYTMIAPLDNAGFPVSYNAGYSVTNPLTMAGALAFDPATGQMDFTPSGPQIVAIAVRVDEYRNGVLIGSVIRDMQIVVIACTNNPPVAGPVSGLSGGTLSGNSFSTCPGNVLSFNITATDADFGQVLSIIETITSNLPGATVNIIGVTSPINISVSWPVPAAALPNYTFSINFRDNACPVLGQQTLGFSITTNPNIVITPSSTNVCPGDNVTLTADPSPTYLWNTGETTQSINVAPLVNTTYSVSGIATGGCFASGSIEVVMASSAPLAITPASPNVCAGNSVTLTAAAATNYVWSTGANSNSITVTPATETVYTVSANIGNCPAEGSVTVTLGNVTGTGVEICQGGSGSLTSNYGCPSIGGTSITQGATFNSGALATSDPRWTRNGTTCSGSAAADEYYDVFSFTVSTAGSYVFDMCAPSFDAHASLYQNAFDGTNPCGTAANFITGNDDSAPSCSADPRLTATLTPGVTYYIVSTAYSGTTTGAYDWTYTGPGGGTIIAGTPGTLEWYTAPTGGTPIGTGSPFNPVGVAGSGLANTNTAGTTTYYLACSGDPTCRTGIDFTIGNVVVAPDVVICSGESGSLTSSSICASSGTLEWYTAPTGGTPIGTGSPFNPVGVAGSGIPNTNTAGTRTYYVACSSSPTCRTAVDYTISGIAATGVTICQGGSGSLTSNSICPSVGGTSIAQGATFNSGALIASDPTWNRNGTTCSGSAGTDDYYDVFSFTVSTAGSYVFDMCAPSFDAHASLYQNAFDGTNPCGTAANFITGNDDSAPLCSADPRLTATLTPGVIYYIVSTSYGAGTTGAYDWTYTGPSGGTVDIGTPGTLEWYTTPTGGTPIGTGPSFNPVGVPGSGLANTNTAGTTTYYVTCPGASSCRTAVDFTIGVVTATGVNICQGGSGSLTSGYTCAPIGTSIAQGATFNSGALAASDPTWDRNNGGTTCDGSAGTDDYYDVFSFTVSTAGSYIFDMCAPSFDAHASLYQNAFDGTNPCGTPSDFIIANDDSAPLCSADPRLTATLTPGVTYYIVSTSYSAGTTGAYDWTYTGPASGTITTGGGASGTLEWYTAAAGGSPIGVGSSFNPVGVAGSGLANTNTVGTTTYYVACSNDPTCRTSVDFDIALGSTALTTVPVSSPLCPNTTITLTATGGTAAAGSSIVWYAGANGTGGLLGTGSSITIAPATTTTVYVRREGGCSGNTPDFGVALNVMDYIYATDGTTTTTYCTDNAGWHHFFTGSNIILSVNGDLSSAGTVTATIRDNGAYYLDPGVTAVCASGFTPGEAQFEMERNWNVDYTGALAGTYDVRYYFEPAERTDVINAAANWMTTYAACGYNYKYNFSPTGWYWYKNQGAPYTAPDYDDDASLAILTGGGTGTTPNGVNYADMNGVASFSGGTGGIILIPDVLLNTAWLYFNGETNNKTNFLSWATEEEQNTAYFNIQRSKDGINFSTIGELTAQGNSTETNHYTYEDKNPFTGENYYRLELVGTDGTVTYSKTIRLLISEIGTNYSFYPNPTNDVVYYQYEATQKEELSIKVLDVLGKEVVKQDVTSTVGLNKIPIDLGSFPMGTYLVRIYNTSAATVHTTKVIKNKE